MKTTIYAVVSLAAILCAVSRCAADSSSPAQTNADYVAGENSAALLTPQLRSAALALAGSEEGAKLLHAIQLTMTMYDLDMTTDAGRRRWHGERHVEIPFNDERCKITVYSNRTTGAVWRYREPYTPRPSKTINPENYTNGVLKAKWATLTPERQQVIAARYAVKTSNTVNTVTKNVTR